MTLHAYSGPDRVYPSLGTGDAEAPTFAPYTVRDGDTVDFGAVSPPADGHWSDARKGATARLADNAPKADEEPAPADPPVDVPTPEDPPTATDPATPATPQES